ncbi:MAG TPA: pepsin/retropepsin-like aspartic protease family protein [Pyrinomonadaceae bacterium]|nr:pepsin/retropepsin-like aspartic protease family protein [Pyrinomonadaceae bacterium]
MFHLELFSRSWIRFILSAIFTISLGAASSAAASDVRFTSGRSALKIPFRLHNNHIYLRVVVNDSAPLWFLLDTGAPNIIDSKHARALGLKLTSAGRATGSGEKEVDVSFTRDVSFALPGVTVARQKSGVLALGNVEECSNEIDVDGQGNISRRRQPLTGDRRQPFDGVLGEEFLRLFVVEIDYAAQLIDLYEPRGYHYSGRGEAIPLEVRPQYVFVRAPVTSSRSGTVTGLFLIDTGFMGALTLNRPFVEKNGLLPPDEQTTPFEFCGIGGTSKSRMGKLESLRLVSTDIKTPVTIFSQATDGNLSRTDFDGLIGNAILRHFNVVFDYSRSRMILESPAKGGT